MKPKKAKVCVWTKRVVSVRPENIDKLLKIFADENVVLNYIYQPACVECKWVTKGKEFKFCPFCGGKIKEKV